MNSTFFISRALAAEREWHLENSRAWGLAQEEGWPRSFMASRHSSIAVIKRKKPLGLWSQLQGGAEACEKVQWEDFERLRAMKEKSLRSVLSNGPNGDQFVEYRICITELQALKIVTEELHQNSISGILIFQFYKTWVSQDWELNKKRVFFSESALLLKAQK